MLQAIANQAVQASPQEFEGRFGPASHIIYCVWPELSIATGTSQPPPGRVSYPNEKATPAENGNGRCLSVEEHCPTQLRCSLTTNEQVCQHSDAPRLHYSPAYSQRSAAAILPYNCHPPIGVSRPQLLLYSCPGRVRRLRITHYRLAASAQPPPDIQVGVTI